MQIGLGFKGIMPQCMKIDLCVCYSISNSPTPSTGLSASTIRGIPGITTKMCYFQYHLPILTVHVCSTTNLEPLKTDLDILSYLLLCTYLQQCSSSQQQPKLWLISISDSKSQLTIDPQYQQARKTPQLP